MTPERWREVKEIFNQVADMDASAQTERLLALCGADTELLSEVSRLLDLGREASSFLETPPTLPSVYLAENPGGSAFEEGDLVCERFRIIRIVGKGGMAEVYEAEDGNLPGLRLAVKTIRPEVAILDSLKEQFRREVELSRQVTHPNVCRVNEIHMHRWPDGRSAWVLSMEFLQGETLSSRLRNSGPMKLDEAWRITSQVGLALEAAHKVGVIHRDFKSSNVMLVPSAGDASRAVVTDFGLAAAVNASGGEPIFTRGGTPGYMAPEQERGDVATRSVDIYSLGVVMHQMLTGQLPFPTKPNESKIPVRATTTLLSDPLPELPRRWQKAIRRCLYSDPALRFKSVNEVLRALDPGGELGRRPLLLGGLSVSAGVAAWLWRRDQIRRVAILPFRVEPQNPESELLADGLADELMQILSGVSGLTLTAKASSDKFRSPSAVVQEAARQLSADALLKGVVLPSQANIKVDVQLHSARSRGPLWNESFVKPVHRVPELPMDIAQSVVKRLGFSLSPPQAERLASTRTANAEAFNWYVLGRKQSQGRVEPALEQSIVSFDKALSLDPGFVLAMCEKASSHVMLSKFSCDSAAGHLRASEELAGKVIQMAPDLAEGHLVLGAIRQKEWKWQPALREFRIATQLNPNLAIAHHWLAGLLSNLADHDEALREIAVARDLDPLSIPVNNALGGLLMQAGLYERAILQFEFTLNLDGVNGIAYNLMAQACSFAGRHDRAMSAIREAIRLEPTSVMHLLCLIVVEGRAGFIASAERRLEEIERRRDVSRFPPYYIAQSYIGVGNTRKAFEWLEVGLKCKDPSFALLKVDPTFKSIRNHTKFRELIQRLAL